MTRRHVIDFYLDNHVAVSFCKVCSAEGDRLFDACSGPITEPIYTAGLTKKKNLKKDFLEQQNCLTDRTKMLITSY